MTVTDQKIKRGIYYLLNKDKFRKNERTYYEKNKLDMAEKKRISYQKNKEKEQQRSRTYYNREKNKKNIKKVFSNGYIESLLEKYY